MLLLLTFAAVSAAALGSVVLYQREAQRRLSGAPEGAARSLPAPRPPTGPAIDRELHTLQLGDVVLEGDEDWLLVGTVHYREEEERWFLHRMEGGRRQRWLYVRAMPAWQALWLEDADDAASFGRLADALTFRARTLELWRRGDAGLRVEGEVMDRSAGQVHYSVYCGHGGEVLVIEQIAEHRRAMAGTRILEGSLTLMPGEGPV